MRRRNSLSSITNSTTEDSNSNSSNSVERRQLNSQISLKHQKCNLLPDCNDDVNKQEELTFLESKNSEKPQEDCKHISSSTSEQQDNDSTSNTNIELREEKEILSLQGKITNSSNAEG